MSTEQHYAGIIERYRDYLPVDANTPLVSLQEGNTPLIALHNLIKAKQLKVKIEVKFEGLNPTGSFKDRGMTLAVSKALEAGSKAVICASTGNTSAAAAAYAARAGMKAFVVIPKGNIALGKLAQAMIHGARVLQIEGNFDEGLAIVKRLADESAITLVNSINPFRLQGQKTAAFEVIEQRGSVPDYHALPVGNAGNISAYWMGYTEYVERKALSHRPVMLGYQAAGAAPFVAGKPIADPETVATAIRIGNPQSWEKACTAQKDSQGWFASVTDEQILQAQKLLAQTEGIFCEPASAASIAGVLQDCEQGRIPPGSSIVCTLTGHGLKDPDIALKQCADQFITVPADFDAVARQLRED